MKHLSPFIKAIFSLPIKGEGLGRGSILLVITLLVSACRTAHSTEKVSSETLSFSHAQSRVSEDTSFSSLFRALSLRADSIVLWLEGGETVPPATCSEDFMPAPTDSIPCSSGSGSTAQSQGRPSVSTRPSSKGRALTKVLIGGLHMESQTEQQQATAFHARDSLMDRAARDASLSESDESEPPNRLTLAYLLIGALLLIIILPLAIRFKKVFF